MRTARVMGTVASLHAPDDPGDEAWSEVLGVFERWEGVFSLWRADSELDRMAHGRLSLPHASPLVREVYAQALGWRAATRGAFTPHRPDGVVDLSGLVKALATDEAGRVLDETSGSWLLGVGGDVLGRGGQAADTRHEPWRCGVVDPGRRDALLGVVELTGRRRAVATSGTAERGEHVWRRESGAVFTQVTVCADDLVTADVLATAILAGTPDDLDGITDAWDVDVATVDRDGVLSGTPGTRGWWRACEVSAQPGR